MLQAFKATGGLMRRWTANRKLAAVFGPVLPCALLLPSAAHAAGNDDLLGPLVSQTFSGIAGSATGTYPGGGLTGSSAHQGTATIAYDAASKSYTVTANGKTQKFAPADIDSASSSATLAVYAHNSPSVQESLTLTRGATSGRFTYQYVGSAYWQRATTAGGGQGSFDAFVYGKPTAAAAVPKTGSASYAIDLLGAGTTPLGASGITGSGTLDVTFETGKFVVSARMTQLYDSLGHDVQLQAQGTLGSDKTFHAPVTVLFDPDKFSGSLDGRFFGPQAQEVGGAWSLTQFGGLGAVNSMVGTFMGRRDNSGGGGAGHFTTPATSFFLTGDGYSVTQNGTKASRKTIGGVEVHYAAGTDTYSASRGPLSFVGSQFSQDQISPTLRVSYASGASDLTGGLEIYDDSALQYVRGGTWSRVGDANTVDSFVFGYQTAQVPVSGLAGYDLTLRGGYLNGSIDSKNNLLFGSGTLVADLAAARFTLQGSATIDYAFGRDDVHGSFKGGGQIAAAKNLLSGPITFTFDSLGKISGRVNGHFFGPKAEEVGLALGAAVGDQSLSAIFFGAPSDATKASALPIAGYSAVTTFGTFPSFLELGAGYTGYDSPKDFENTSAITWDPANHQYTVPLAIYYQRAVTLAFGPKQAAPASSDGLYDAYAMSADGKKWTAQVYKQGSSEIALTYTSFMRIATRLPTKAGVAGNDTFYWLPYGSQTADAMMPRSGKASYALAIRGDAVLFGVKREHLALTGSGLLKADFTAQQLAMTATFAGTTDAAVPIKLETLKYTGWISGSGWGAYTAPGRYQNTARGHFFGLTAGEVGGIFRYESDVTGNHVLGNGVIVGKRN